MLYWPAANALCRIQKWIPKDHHPKIYHALFESHLSYGITVWGGVANSKINEIFKIQKHCMRILFGDKIAYLDKFSTCARVRPFGEQKLGAQFYRREHTKNLFNKNEILTTKNLHHYFCGIEVFKILKLRAPVSVHDIFSLSNREESVSLITPRPSVQFSYHGPKIWNSIYKKVVESNDLSTKISHVKRSLKNMLLEVQKQGLSPEEWELQNFKLPV